MFLKCLRKVSGFPTVSDSPRGLEGEKGRNCSLLALSLLIDYKDRGSNWVQAGKWVTKTYDTNVEALLMPARFWLQLITKLLTILFQLLSPGIHFAYLVGEKTLLDLCPWQDWRALPWCSIKCFVIKSIPLVHFQNVHIDKTPVRVFTATRHSATRHLEFRGFTRAAPGEIQTWTNSSKSLPLLVITVN